MWWPAARLHQQPSRIRCVHGACSLPDRLSHSAPQLRLEVRNPGSDKSAPYYYSSAEEVSGLARGRNQWADKSGGANHACACMFQEQCP